MLRSWHLDNVYHSQHTMTSSWVSGQNRIAPFEDHAEENISSSVYQAQAGFSSPTFSPGCIRVESHTSLPRSSVCSRGVSSVSLSAEPNKRRSSGSSKGSERNSVFGSILRMRSNPFKLYNVDNKHALRVFRSQQAIAAEALRHKAQTESRFIIHPYSLFKWHWDLVVACLIVYTVSVLPVVVAFFDDGVSDSWFAFNCFVDVVYIVDVFLNFRTGIVKYTREVPEVILDPKQIAIEYLKSNFLVDFLSSFPFDYIVTISQGGSLREPSPLQATNTIKFLRFAKLLALLRLLKVTKLVRGMREFQDALAIGPGTVKMLNLSMLVLLIAHWNGCIQFIVARFEDFPDGSWVSQQGLKDSSPSVQYAWALFKALSHMLCIGYGQAPPITLTECWLTIWSVLMGATFFAMFIGTMTTVLASIDTASRGYSYKVSALNEYMHIKRVPKVTRQKVREYFDEACLKQKWFEEEEILKGLSRNLKMEILRHSRGQILKMVPFLRDTDELFLDAIATILEPQVAIPGERVVRFLIQYGTLQGEECPAAVLSDGMYFGEIGCIEGHQRTADVVATTACRIFLLSREKFLPLLKSRPSVFAKLQKTARQRLVHYENRGAQQGRFQLQVPKSL